MKKPDCKKCRENNRMEFVESTFGKCKTCEPWQKYEAWLESKRKFIAGGYIHSIDHLLDQEWVMYHGKAKHISFVLNNQLFVVLKWIDAGILRLAIRKTDVAKDEL